MKIFYGWKMVFAAASLQFLQSMMLHQAFGAYLAVLIEETTEDAIANALNELLDNKEHHQLLTKNNLFAREVYCWQKQEITLLNF